MPREGLSEIANHRILNQPRGSPGKEQSSRGNTAKRLRHKGRNGTGVEVPQTPMRQTEKGEDREEFKRTTREKKSDDEEQLEPPEPKEE